jgi:hypothetical protein
VGVLGESYCFVPAFYHVYNLKKLTVPMLLPVVVKFSLQVILCYCNILLNVSLIKCNCIFVGNKDLRRDCVDVCKK